MSNDKNTLSYEYNPTDIEIDGYAELNNLSLTVLGIYGDSLENYQIAFNDGATLEGKSLYVDKRSASVKCENQNDQVIVTIINPLRGHTYSATLTNTGESNAVTESVEIDKYLPSQTITLNTTELDGSYNLVIKDGDTAMQLPEGSASANFDHTGPVVTGIEVSEDKTSVIVTLDEEVGVNDSTPDIALNLKRAAVGTQDWENHSVVGARLAEYPTVISYVFDLSNLEDINTKYGTGTVYEFADDAYITGSDTHKNPISINVDRPEYTKTVDNTAPVFNAENVKFVDLPDSGITNQDVTVSVTFAEGKLPDDGSVTLTYNEGSPESSSTVNMIEVEKDGVTSYEYKFNANENSEKTFVVESVSASDGKKSSTVTIQKSFVIDTVSPEVTVTLNKVGISSVGDYYGDDLSVKFASDEALTVSFNYNEKTEQIELNDPESDGSFEGTFTFNTPVGSTIKYGSISFHGTDVAGNDISFNGDTSIADFSVDKKNPIFSNAHFTAYDDNNNPLDDGAQLNEISFANGYAVYSFTITDEDSGVDGDAFNMTDLEGNIIAFDVEKENDDYNFTVKAPLNITGIIVSAKDMVGNSGSYRFEKPLILETEAPVVNITNEADLGSIENNFTVNYSVTDGPEDSSSGFKDITYWLTRNGSEEKVHFSNTADGNAGQNQYTVAEASGSIVLTSCNSADIEQLDGEYTLHIAATDNATNVSTEKTVDLQFDSTGPKITDEGSAPGIDVPYNTHTFNVSMTDEAVHEVASGFENVVYYLTKVENGVDTDVRIPFNNGIETKETFTSEESALTIKVISTEEYLLNGEFVLHVTAYDAAQNLSEIQFRRTYDNSNPSVVINDEITNGTLPSKEHTVKFDISDPVSEGVASGVSTYTYYLTKNGSEEKEEFISNDGTVNTQFTVSAANKSDITVKSSDNNVLNGIYTLHIVAEDAADNSAEDTVQLHFDNEAPVITVDETATNGSAATLTHTVVITSITDGPVECPSGVNNTRYWLTMAGSDEKVKFSTVQDGSNASYEFEYKPETADKSGNIIVTSSSAEGDKKLNGIFELHIVSTDSANNSYEITPVELHFDNEAPVITIDYDKTNGTVTNTSHVVSIESIVDKPDDSAADIASVTYWLTKKGSEDHETFSNNMDPESTDYTYPSIGYAGGEIFVNSPENGEVLSGVYTFYISAVDANGNTSSEQVELYFDNTVPDINVTTTDEEFEASKQFKTIKLTVTDLPSDEAASGVSGTKYWLTDAEGTPVSFANDDEESELTYRTITNAAEFTIDSEQLTGTYTLHISSIDNLGNGHDPEVDGNTDLNGMWEHEIVFDNTDPEMSDLKYDENTPEDSLAEQQHDITFSLKDGPAGYSSGIQKVEYWLTNVDGQNVAFAGNDVDVTEETGYVATLTSFTDNTEGTEGFDNKLAAVTIKSPSSGEKLNGNYTLHIQVYDVAKNTSVEYESPISFDTDPLKVSISYEFTDTYNFYENDGIYTNVNPTVTVKLTDNFRIDAEDIAFIRNGLAEAENIEFEETAEFSTSYTLSYELGSEDVAEEIEDIRNTFTFTGSDHAGNGAVVTENYNSDKIANPEDKTIGADATAENGTFTTAYNIIVDKINPVYTMNYGSYNDDEVAGNAYDDDLREYFGSDKASSFLPTVVFIDKNYDASKFNVGYSYSDGGDGHYEDVTFDSVTTWSTIPTETTSGNAVSMVHLNSLVTNETTGNQLLRDGVYMFAVKGEDKAGNKLVQSDAEETKNNSPHKSVVQSNAGEFWTEYKIVDTQIGSELLIKPSNSDEIYRYAKTPSEFSDTNAYMYWSDTNAAVSVNTDAGNYREMSKNTITYDVVSSMSSANQSYERNDAYGVLSATLSGEQRFHVNNLVVTDRAGNSISYSMSKEVFLDVRDPNQPTIDPDAPVATVKALTEYTARSADGRDLYNRDVTLKLTVTEPNADICSGLASVTYEVIADGRSVFGETVTAPFDNPNVPSWTRDITVTNETNNIEVRLTAVDKAGNAVDKPTVYNFGIDKQGPIVTVEYDNNDVSHDKYFKANRTATVTIRDRNINFANIHVDTEVGYSGLSSITQDGTVVGETDVRTFTIPYTADGDYTLQISGTDALGNPFQGDVTSTSQAPWEFTIDKTAPVINVSFNNNDVRNGKYYNAARVATVTIDEHNFLADEVTIDQTASIQRGTVGVPGPSGFGTSGDSHSATINYSADGNYTLTVSYTDMAGNEAEQVVVPEFTIDTTKPVVRFDENTVTDNMATNGVIAPSIIFDDTNFDANGISVSLKGARVDNHNHPFTRTITQFGSVVTFSDFARVKESDDIYTARATITDLAGNTAEATVRFSVNRFGSTFDFNDDEPTIDLVNGYYAQETDNVIIREVNVNKLTGYTLTVNRDGSNITLVEGEDFRVISSAIAGGYQYIYEIFPEVFTSEGTYSIIVQSVDEAGNTNTNSTVRTDDGVNDYPVVFAIDKTLPTVSIDELDPDDRSNNNFNENTKTFRISVRDNNAMSRVIVTVDGNVVFDMEGQELAEYLEEHGGFVEITLDASSGYQTIKVQAFDGAGNESADTQYQVLVTTNFFVRFFYNKPLFYGSIIFLILLLLAIAYYVKKRMDKQKKNA